MDKYNIFLTELEDNIFFKHCYADKFNVKTKDIVRDIIKKGNTFDAEKWSSIYEKHIQCKFDGVIAEALTFCKDTPKYIVDEIFKEVISKKEHPHINADHEDFFYGEIAKLLFARELNEVDLECLIKTYPHAFKELVEKWNTAYNYHKDDILDKTTNLFSQKNINTIADKIYFENLGFHKKDNFEDECLFFMFCERDIIDKIINNDQPDFKYIKQYSKNLEGLCCEARNGILLNNYKISDEDKRLLSSVYGYVIPSSKCIENIPVDIASEYARSVAETSVNAHYGKINIPWEERISIDFANFIHHDLLDKDTQFYIARLFFAEKDRSENYELSSILRATKIPELLEEATVKVKSTNCKDDVYANSHLDKKVLFKLFDKYCKGLIKSLEKGPYAYCSKHLEALSNAATKMTLAPNHYDTLLKMDRNGTDFLISSPYTPDEVFSKLELSSATDFLYKNLRKMGLSDDIFLAFGEVADYFKYSYRHANLKFSNNWTLKNLCEKFAEKEDDFINLIKKSQSEYIKNFEKCDKEKFEAVDYDGNVFVVGRESVNDNCKIYNAIIDAFKKQCEHNHIIKNQVFEKYDYHDFSSRLYYFFDNLHKNSNGYHAILYANIDDHIDDFMEMYKYFKPLKEEYIKEKEREKAEKENKSSIASRLYDYR